MSGMTERAQDLAARAVSIVSPRSIRSGWPGSLIGDTPRSPRRAPRGQQRVTRPLPGLGWRTLGAALLIATACAERPGPTEPADALEFDPPLRYHTLWRTAEACGGELGDFDAVTWFQTAGSAVGGRSDVAGSWWPNPSRIYLNENFLSHDEVVRHEMLHALLRGKEHEPAFANSCRDLVVCESDCLQEAGSGPVAGPTSSSPEIAPSELLVSAMLIAPLERDSGWTTLVVSATNPHPYPVWVDLSPDPGIQFDCYFDGFFRCGGRNYEPGSRGAFGANETRREAAVFRLGPGAHSIVGSYNANQAAPINVTVPHWQP